MNAVALFVFGLGLLIIQTTLFSALGLSAYKAPLVLCLVVYAAFYLEEIRGLILSFFLGYAMDVYSGGIQGITPLVMIILCFIGQRLRQGIVVDGKAALVIVAFVFGMMHGLLWLEMEALVKGRLLPQELPISRILIQSTVLAAASPFIVAIASPIDQRTSFGWRVSDSEP